MLVSLLAASAALSGPPPRIGRRAAVSSGLLTAGLSLPNPAWAEKTTSQYASGYFEAPPLEVAMSVIVNDVFTPLNAALQASDWSTAAKLYAPDATLVDGYQRCAFVLGSNVGTYLPTAPAGTRTLQSVVLEGEVRS